MAYVTVAAFVVGLGLVSVGAWLLAPWLGLVAAGVACMVFARVAGGST